MNDAERTLVETIQSRIDAGENNFMLYARLAGAAEGILSMRHHMSPEYTEARWIDWLQAMDLVHERSARRGEAA